MPLCFYVLYQETIGVVETRMLKVLHMSYFVSATSSLLTITTLSVDRYVAIMNPHNYKRWFTLQTCVIVSVFIWVISLCTSFIYFLLGYIHYLMLFANVTIVAGVVVIVASVRTSKHLRQQAQRMLKSKSVSAPRHSVAVYSVQELHYEKKITGAFLIILGTFLTVYTPTLLMTYVLHFCLTCGCLVNHVLRDDTFLLVCCNSIVNPFVYSLRVKALRKALLLVMKCAKNNETTRVSNSNVKTYVINTSI